MPEKVVFYFLISSHGILQPAGSGDKLYAVPPAERSKSLSETWHRYAFVFSLLITGRKKIEESFIFLSKPKCQNESMERGQEEKKEEANFSIFRKRITFNGSADLPRTSHSQIYRTFLKFH